MISLFIVLYITNITCIPQINYWVSIYLFRTEEDKIKIIALFCLYAFAVPNMLCKCHLLKKSKEQLE